MMGEAAVVPKGEVGWDWPSLAAFVAAHVSPSKETIEKATVILKQHDPGGRDRSPVRQAGPVCSSGACHCSLTVGFSCSAIKLERNP